MPTRILAIHAHPDDVEILAGGTVALLSRLGHAVTIVTMTPGDCGSTELNAEEIAGVRREEAAAAARLIGADYFCAEFRDLTIFNTEASRRRVAETLRRAAPDMVLTSSPRDYMSDHEMTSSLVRDACFAAPVANYMTGVNNPSPRLKAIPHLYFMDPIGGVDTDGNAVPADFYVNVEETFAIKREMLAKHRSQRDWLLKHHGMDDYIEQMDRWTRDIGARAGLKYGEGFRRYKGHPYPQSPLLEDLLDGYVRRP
jgi:LmbE family N-acetylglucosaminyl deacetylase